ncbi:MAG: molybdate ABC transporter permease subunit [Pseudomonadota bacterium]|nr:molybdate ABC transporter permease subunit [Pseudomonadota bacterium]
MLEAADISAIWVTIKLAFISTFLLLLLGTPLAWWLAISRSKFKPVVNALVALPLVLPPTVLGFYLLLALSPNGVIGRVFMEFGGTSLAFSFSGLVIGSVIYSLPFVVQPLRDAFNRIGIGPLETAATLGATPIDRFLTIVLPLSWPGYLTASVLGFAHTVGEFGVVLMIGGNIPGRTKVLSVSIYEQVEQLNYDKAHTLSGLLLIVSFLLLLLVYISNRRSRVTQL